MAMNGGELDHDYDYDYDYDEYERCGGPDAPIGASG
jgi:hypothetical protein